VSAVVDDPATERPGAERQERPRNEVTRPVSVIVTTEVDETGTGAKGLESGI
jgi:hypothetical protein